MLNTNEVRYCAENDDYVLRTTCKGFKDCECDCHVGVRYFTQDPETFGGRPIATVTYDRSLPEEDEPQTNIHITRSQILYLSTIVADALERRPHDNIVLRIT